MERKIIRRLSLFCPCVGIALLFCIILLSSGNVTLVPYGFAVDNNSNLYVGESGRIVVYCDSNPIKEIETFTSKTYAFTITDNKHILLSNASKTYEMDLNGDVLSIESDSAAHTYSKLRSQRRCYNTDIDSYRMINMLGRTQIVKNGTETIYKISLLSFAVKVILFLCIILFICFTIWNLRTIRAYQKK